MGKMKKIVALAFTAIMIGTMLLPIKTEAASKDVALNATNFPDAKFLGYLTQNADGIKFDINGDGILQTTELNKVTELDVSGKGIKSLAGIENFKNLEKLECNGNLMTSLDLSQNTRLTYLDCSYCELVKLDISKNTQIGSLVCNNNKLTSLVIGNNTAINTIACINNSLTTLDISKCTNLEVLECYDNQLTSLNITNNTKLEMLYCQNNKISSLNFTSNHGKLTTVKCQNNALAKLYFSSTRFLNDVSVEKQSISATLIQDGSKQFIDMSSYAFDEYRLEVTGGATYDATTKCLVLKNNATVGSKITYNYDTKKGNMDVTITISSVKNGKYPSVGEEPTTPTPTQPQTTQPPTTEPPKPTQPQTPSPKETTAPTEKPTQKPTQKPTEKPTQKPTGQPVTDDQGETKTDASGEVITEPVTEPSGENNTDETTDYVPMESVTSDDGGPFGKNKDWLPILIGAVIALVVIVIVLILLITKSNKKNKGKKVDKYKYNNRIRY